MEVHVKRLPATGDESALEVHVSRETHTLGCILEAHLRRDPSVTSAAFVQDHPLQDSIRLQVTGTDPAASVSKATVSAIAEVEAGVAACRQALRDGDFALCTADSSAIDGAGPLMGAPCSRSDAAGAL